MKRLRPLLHLLLAAAVAGPLVLAIGLRRGMMLAATLLVGKELAEIAFDFGFDWNDLADLASEAAGLALTWVVWRQLSRHRWFLRFAPHKEA